MHVYFYYLNAFCTNIFSHDVNNKTHQVSFHFHFDLFNNLSTILTVIYISSLYCLFVYLYVCPSICVSFREIYFIWTNLPFIPEYDQLSCKIYNVYFLFIFLLRLVYLFNFVHRKFFKIDGYNMKVKRLFATKKSTKWTHHALIFIVYLWQLNRIFY